MDIKIEYNGTYPNLCSGHLVVITDGNRWDFPRYCLNSGGYAGFDSDWNARVEDGPWSIKDWPMHFPEKWKEQVVEAVNENISWGCCGGCL